MLIAQWDWNLLYKQLILNKQGYTILSKFLLNSNSKLEVKNKLKIKEDYFIIQDWDWDLILSKENLNNLKSIYSIYSFEVIENNINIRGEVVSNYSDNDLLYVKGNFKSLDFDSITYSSSDFIKENYIDQVFDNLSEGILIYDSKYNILFVNNLFKEWFQIDNNKLNLCENSKLKLDLVLASSSNKIYTYQEFLEYINTLNSNSKNIDPKKYCSLSKVLDLIQSNFIKRNNLSLRDLKVLEVSDKNLFLLKSIFSTSDKRDSRKQLNVEIYIDISFIAEVYKLVDNYENRIKTLLNSSLDGVMEFKALRDKDNKIIDFIWISSNKKACELVQKSEDELIDKSMLEVMPGHIDSGLFEEYIKVVETNQVLRKEFYYIYEGLEGWVENTAIKYEDGFIVSFRDINKLKDFEAKLLNSHKELEETITRLNKYNNEIIILDELSNFIQACSNLDEVLKVTSLHLIKLIPTCSGRIHLFNSSRNKLISEYSWGDTIHSKEVFNPEDCWALKRGTLHSTLNKSEVNCNHIDSSKCIKDLIHVCVPLHSQSDIIGLLYIEDEILKSNSHSLVENNHSEDNLKDKERFKTLISSVSERLSLAISNIKLKERLRNESIRDPLTGLFNRRYLNYYLESQIGTSIRKSYSIGFILIDIDNFKSFNDNYGHQTGDIVIQKVSKVLTSNVRDADIVCRYGGEEILIVLPEINLKNLYQKAEALRELISTIDLTFLTPTNYISHHNIDNITVSVGVDLFSPISNNHLDKNSLNNLRDIEPLLLAIQNADLALYQAKREGKNKVVNYKSLSFNKS